MTEGQEIETYLSISRFQIGIYLFDIKQYKILWDEHTSGKRNWQFLMLNFLVFQLWYENWDKKILR